MQSAPVVASQLLLVDEVMRAAKCVGHRGLGVRGRVQQGVDVAEQGGDGRLEAWNPKPVMFQATRSSTLCFGDAEPNQANRRHCLGGLILLNSFSKTINVFCLPSSDLQGRTINVKTKGKQRKRLHDRTCLGAAGAKMVPVTKPVR
eukprot:33958-Pelagomonas_calceolata.AAC.5